MNKLKQINKCFNLKINDDIYDKLLSIRRTNLQGLII